MVSGGRRPSGSGMNGRMLIVNRIDPPCANKIDPPKSNSYELVVMQKGIKL
jgi:hypothetical protein